jgi:Uma2 family endonuclease
MLHNVSWETYARLVAERGDRRVPRFAYDRGELEIMSPSTEHESVAYFLGLLVALFAGETGVNAYGVGSTTFKREDLERGFEPDSCFYVQNEERIRGKSRIDLDVDPPPDLVIGVDITSPSPAKFPIYARIGVREIWRHDGERVSIFVLRGARMRNSPRARYCRPSLDRSSPAASRRAKRLAAQRGRAGCASGR